MGSLLVEQLGLVVSPRHHLSPSPLLRGFPHHLPLSPSPLTMPSTPLYLLSQLSDSPRHLDMSPRHLDVSPRPLDVSPRPLDMSPRPLDVSPGYHDVSPRQLFMSPKHLSASPCPFPMNPRITLSPPKPLPVSPDSVSPRLNIRLTPPRVLPVYPGAFLASPVALPGSPKPLPVYHSPFPLTASLFPDGHSPFSFSSWHRKRCDSQDESPSSARTLFGEAAPGGIKYSDIKNIRVMKVLGSGGFGTVYQGVMRGGLVAVKQLRAHTGNAHAQMESYRAELNLLTLCHPHVVAALCAAPSGNGHAAMLVMEYVSDRNLLHVINDVTEPLGVERRLKYAHHLAEALVYIHARCVVHLDLKPSNVLITPHDTCKLGDFGCSQLLTQEKQNLLALPSSLSVLQGTAAYRAPELLKGEAPSRKSDIYALGVTLWQMLARQVPYGGENHHVVIFGVVAHGLRPWRWTPGDVAGGDEGDGEAVDDHPVEQLYLDVMSQCWDGDRGERPTAEVLSDVFDTWLGAY